MKCSNTDIHGLLPDYVSGDLSQDNRLIVEAHLNECPECHEFIERAGKMFGYVDKFVAEAPAEHIAIETLIAYAEDPTALSEDQIVAVEDHLAVCDYCQNAHADVVAINQELEDVSEEPSEQTASTTPVTRIDQAIRSTIVRPLFAYGVAAAAAVMAFFVGTQQTVYRFAQHAQVDTVGAGSDNTERRLGEGLGPLEVHYPRSSITAASYADHLMVAEQFLLKEVTRHPGDLAEVVRNTGDMLIRVAVTSFWPDLEREDYSIALIDDAGEVFFEEPDFNRFGEQGLTEFLVPCQSLSDGKYTLRILARDTANQQPTKAYDFPFALITSE